MALTTNAISLDAPTAGSALAERTNHTLLKIVKANFNTKYAAQAPILSAFRDAVSAHGGTDADVTLIADFRTHVPLSSYDCYKPFVDKFNMQPCKKEEVDNLFAPGLPEFLAATSATTRLTPKILPKYDHSAGQAPVRFQFVDPDSKYPLAALQYCGCMDIKEVGNAMGQVVQRIPLCIVSSGGFRRVLGWKIDDDESRMSLTSTLCSSSLDDSHSCHLPCSAILCGAMGGHHHRPLSFLPDNSWSLLPYTSERGSFLCNVRDRIR